MNYKNNVLKVNGSELISLLDLIDINNKEMLVKILKNAINNYPYILDSKSKIIIEIGNMYDCKYTFIPSTYGCKYDRKTN